LSVNKESGCLNEEEEGWAVDVAVVKREEDEKVVADMRCG
jgi:hypothetical protein